MTQNNLGIVLAVLGERASGEQGAQYLEQSVAAYRAALEVRTREQLPQDWATTQNNLGNVLSVLGRTGERRTRCAISRAVGGRLSRGLGSLHARAIAAGLGHDAEQSGHRAQGSWRTGERRTRCAVFTAVSGCPRKRLKHIHA